MSEACGIPFKRDFLHPRYWLTWLGLGFGVLLSWSPMLIRRKCGQWLGSLIYRYNKKRMSVIVTNLRIAFPQLTDQEIQQKALKSIQWYGRAMVDYCVLFFSPAKRLHKRIRIEGADALDQAIDAGDNAIILLMHSCWLDFAPAGLGAKYSLYGSYKSVSNPVVDWLMAKSRCRHVESVIARDEGMMKLVRSLKPGKLLVFLPDEDLGIEHADFSPFFGKDKATLNTPARIAKLKSARCFPCFTYFDETNNQYCVKLGEALSPFPGSNAVENAAILNKSMEDLIYIEPDQYMWLLKLYKTRPLGESPVYSQ